MLRKVAAVVLAVGSVVGAIVRLRQGDYLYLFASIGGLSLAVWLWNQGGEPASQTEGGSASG
jgi:hypothetical protein